MKLEDTITLLKAGYTKEEILAMDEPAAKADAITSKPADEEPAKDEPKQAPAQPAQENSALMEAIRELNKSIQKMNIQNSSIPNADKTEVLPEDLLAQIVNPQPKPRK